MLIVARRAFGSNTLSIVKSCTLTLTQRTMSSQDAPVNINYLSLGNDKKIAYEKIGESGGQKPTVIYIPGFMSGKDGDKARHLRKFCCERELPFVRYDPTCIGDSPGSWETLEFKDWIENAEAVVESVGAENNILVGSSMGGWISLLLASRSMFKQNIKALVLIAPALNFLRPFYQQIYANSKENVRRSLDNGEVQYLNWHGHENLPVRKAFQENSLEFEIDLSEKIGIECPVKILHGVLDDSVPYKNSLDIMNKLETNNVELFYRKSDGHSFTTSGGLDLLEATLVKTFNSVYINK